MLAVFASAAVASAGIFTFEVGRLVPDGVGSGLADVRTIADVPFGLVPTVGLSFSGVGGGMINGDLYVSLSHEDGNGDIDAWVVLVNRPGKRADNDEGYLDSGMSIRLTADPGAPDLHTYRRWVTGSDALPLGGPLGGLWSPDGRTTDPALVLDTDSRATALGAFGAVDPVAGRWALFVADLLPGGEARLDRWSLEFALIPEPRIGATVSVLGLGLFAAWRWRRVGRSGRR